MVTKTLEENSSKLQKLFVKTVERIYTKRDAIAADIAEDKASTISIYPRRGV